MKILFWYVFEMCFIVAENDARGTNLRRLEGGYIDSSQTAMRLRHYTENIKLGETCTHTIYATTIRADLFTTYQHFHASNISEFLIAPFSRSVFLLSL